MHHSLALRSFSVLKKTSRILSLDKLDQLFGHNAQQHIPQKPKALHQLKNLIRTVKHGGGWVIIWAGFIVTGPHSHWIGYKVIWITEYFRVKCEAICLTAGICPEMGRTTEPLSQTNHCRTVGKENNERALVPVKIWTSTTFMLRWDL